MFLAVFVLRQNLKVGTLVVPRIVILMRNVLTVALLDPACLHHLGSCSVTTGTALLLLFSALPLVFGFVIPLTLPIWLFPADGHYAA